MIYQFNRLSYEIKSKGLCKLNKVSLIRSVQIPLTASSPSAVIQIATEEKVESYDKEISEKAGDIVRILLCV